MKTNNNKENCPDCEGHLVTDSAGTYCQDNCGFEIKV